MAPPHVYKAFHKVGHSWRGLLSTRLCWFLDVLVLEDNVSMTSQLCIQMAVYTRLLLLVFGVQETGRQGDCSGLCVLCCVERAGNEDSCISCVTLGMVPMDMKVHSTGDTFPARPSLGYAMWRPAITWQHLCVGGEHYGSSLETSQMLT